MTRQTLFTPTSTTTSDFAAYPASSYVAELASGALAVARERHVAFTATLAALDSAVQYHSSCDVRGAAQLAALRRYIILMDQAGKLAAGVVRSASDAGALEGAVAPFLAGAYLWLDGALCAMADLSKAFVATQVDAGVFSASLAEVSWLHEMLVAEHARVDAGWAFESLALSDAADDLLALLVILKEALNTPLP